MSALPGVGLHVHAACLPLLHGYRDQTLGIMPAWQAFANSQLEVEQFKLFSGMAGESHLYQVGPCQFYGLREDFLD